MIKREEIKSFLIVRKALTIAEALDRHAYISNADPLSEWLKNNTAKLKDIFGAGDTIYICFKTREAAQELLNIIQEHHIGDELTWEKFLDSEDWYLSIWWD